MEVATFERKTVTTRTDTETRDVNYERKSTETTTTKNASGYYEYVITVPQTKTFTRTKTDVTASSTVKPRIMLVLDDSGSMETEGGVPNRLTSLKNVLKKLMTDEKYDKTILWNAFTLNSSGGGQYTKGYGNGPVKYPMFKEFTNGKNMYDNGIAHVGTSVWKGSSATPTTISFVYAANELFRNINYKCQNNFIILLSDGDTNFDTYQTGGYGYNSYYTTETSIAAWEIPALRTIYELSDGAATRHLPIAYSYALPTYTAAWHAMGTGCASSPQKSGPWCRKDKTYHAFTTSETSSCNGLVTGKGTDWKRFDHHCVNSSNWNGVYNGIEYFTDKLYNKDLKPDSERDAEGNAFTGKQNIQTFTIGYGNDMSAQGEAYAILGSRVDDKFKNKNPDKRKVTTKPKRNDDDGYGYYPETGYYWIDDGQKDTQLQEAFTEIFDNVVSSTVNISETSSNISDTNASISPGNPTTTSSSHTNTTTGKPETNTSTGATTSKCDDEKNKDLPECKGTVSLGKESTPHYETTPLGTSATEDLYTTSVASPVNISSFNLDVSMYPDLTPSEPITDKTSSSELGAYGMEMTLGINTGNWASFFSFHPIFRINVPEGKSVATVIDTTKYNCNVSGTSEKAITSYVCSYNNDDYFTPKFLSQRPVLMTLPTDNEKRSFGLTAQGFAEFGLTENGKANNQAHSIYKNFGFEDAQLQEFNTGFFPWLLRDGTVTDEQIEENVAKLNLAERGVSKYRNRLEIAKSGTKVPEIERQMGDVIDATPINIPSYVPIADTAEEQKELEAGRDRAQYLLVGSNDGMLYSYKRANSTTNPYELKFNYLPYKMPRERYRPNRAADMTYLETLGSVLPVSIASSDYGTGANEHIYGINGQLNQIRTATLTKAATGDKQLRERLNVVTGTMGQGGRGVFSLLALGVSPKDNSSRVGFDNELTKGGNWEQYNDTASKEVGTVPTDTSINLGYTVNTAVVSKTATKWTDKKCADEKSSDDDTTAIASCSTYETMSMPKADVLDSEIRYTTFVANGFPTGGKDNSSELIIGRDNHDSAPTLYIFDALGLDFKIADRSSSVDYARNASSKAGQLIKKISVPDASTNPYNINTLGSPTVVDIDFDGIADVVYAGDYSGNLWRFDLRGKVSDWGAIKLFQGNSERPITAAPAVYRIDTKHLNGEQYMVAFGTGSDVYKEDRESTQPQQRIYGIRDDLRVRPKVATTGSDDGGVSFTLGGSSSDTSNSPSGAITIKYPLTDDKLVGRNFVDQYRNGHLERYAEQEASTVGFNDDGNYAGYGWYVNLNAGIPGEKSSERVIAKPSLLTRAVFFTSRAYDLSSTSTIHSEIIPTQVIDSQEGDWEITKEHDWEDVGERTDYKKTEGETSKQGGTGGSGNGDGLNEAEQTSIAQTLQGEEGCDKKQWIDETTGYTYVVECPTWGDATLTDDDWKLVQKGVPQAATGKEGEESCNAGAGVADIYQATTQVGREKKITVQVPFGGASDLVETQEWIENWIQKQERKVDYSKTDVKTFQTQTNFEEESKGAVEGETWFFAVDILTGGNLQSNGVKIVPDYSTEEYDEKDETFSKIIGIHFDTITSAAVIQSLSKLLDEDLAITENGEYRGGDDQDMKLGKGSDNFLTEQFQDNRCVKHADYIALLNANPELKKVSILPPLCHGVFMRTSLREIRGISK